MPRYRFLFFRSELANPRSMIGYDELTSLVQGQVHFHRSPDQTTALWHKVLLTQKSDCKAYNLHSCRPPNLCRRVSGLDPQSSLAADYLFSRAQVERRNVILTNAARSLSFASSTTAFTTIMRPMTRFFLFSFAFFVQSSNSTWFFPNFLVRSQQTLQRHQVPMDIPMPIPGISQDQEEAPSAGTGDLTLSDVIGKERKINIFAGFTRTLFVCCPNTRLTASVHR